ncbi:MAG TPA: putative toxin-antitoxin system toxin component, PIN family [Gammaproteobacteria bacterium]|nr:putative toxin-antitoxin system toxin component, PIN family [Gammaproteobacteria bacterium]
MRADRVVLDSNVLISALLSPNGSPRRAFEHLAKTSAALLFSDETFAELAGRIALPKFDRYRSIAQMNDCLDWLVELSEWVHPGIAVVACRDSRDDKFLTVALGGEADILITGDADLLVFDPFEGLPIVSPAKFLKGEAGTDSKGSDRGG